MKKQALIIILMISTILLFGQSPNNRNKEIGINYFGELGFRPGIEVDYGLNFWEKENEGKRRLITHQLYFRPSFAYYHYPHFSNNILLSTKLNYRIKFTKKENAKYLFVEPFVRVGFLRYFLAGEVFESGNNGFAKVNSRGSNSIIFGGAFDIGGYVSKRFDWLVGFDYYAESTEDKLILHRFVAKLGTRIKLNAK